MSYEHIPDTVRTLIADRLDSVPELEAVLLLRQDATHEWTPDEAGRRLYVSTTVAAHVLAQLHAHGFLTERAGAYRYAPHGPAIADAVDQLATTWARHLVAVTNLIHAKASPNARAFADAFRFRKPT